MTAPPYSASYVKYKVSDVIPTSGKLKAYENVSGVLYDSSGVIAVGWNPTDQPVSHVFSS